MTEFRSQYNGCYPISDTNINILLAASTAISWTVPGTSSQTYRAEFSVASNADVWVCKSATAAVPTSNTVTSTRYQERIGINYARYVQGGDVLSFISTGTPQVGVTLLSMPV